MGVWHLLNINWFWLEDFVTTLVMNTVALILCIAKTLIWFKGLYIFPILDFSPGSFTQRSSVCGNQPLVWLNTIVTDHSRDMYMTFWNTCQYRLVAIWSINLRYWWWGECLKPVFVEKRACVNTLTLRYLGDCLLIAALLLTGLSVFPICVQEGQGVLVFLGGTSRNFWRCLISRSHIIKCWRACRSCLPLFICSRYWPGGYCRLRASRGPMRRSVGNRHRLFICVSCRSSILTPWRCSGYTEL